MNSVLQLADRYGKTMEVHVESLRQQQSWILAKFVEISDRGTADRFAGGGVDILEEHLAELPPDSYYVKDIVGMTVVNEHGEQIGIVTRVLAMPASDVYEINIGGELKLVPAVSEFVRSIDAARRRITLHTIPGLIDSDDFVV